jgi:transposase-like protein
MKRYPAERKEAVLKKMLPPENMSVAQIAEEEGISMGTLFNWRKQARAEGRLLPGRDSIERWNSRDKFAAVMETASLSEAEVAEYCRKRGMYPQQIQEWREACEMANDWKKESSRELKEAVDSERNRVKELERELRRKEKALAETAALLVLRKKMEAIWGDSEDE